MKVDIVGKVVVVDTITSIINAITKAFNKYDKKAISKAILAIQKATIKTRNFITDHGYKRNEELSDLWHNAFDKVVEAKIDEGLPDFLYQKAKFWGEPSDWIKHPASLELIPKLSDLDKKCDLLLVMIKKK
jgi:hypothetical protein